MLNEKVTMMKCGHAANATANGKPCCAICVGILAGAEMVSHMVPSADRLAQCAYCKTTRPSSQWESLAFFENHPNKKFDGFYCGCRGWD